MDQHIIDVTLKGHLREIRGRLDQAASLAKAAEACAEAGSVDGGIEVSLDIEPLLYEAKTLLVASTMMRRFFKDST